MHLRWICLLLLLIAPAAAGETESRAEAIRLNEVGIRELEAGEYERAIATFVRARSLLPEAPTLRRNQAAAHSSWGVELSKEDKLTEAVAQLGKAVLLEPDIALYQLNLGTLLYRTGRLGEARKALDRAVALEPGNIAARVALGRIHYRAGELPDAIRHWEAAFERDPVRSGIGNALLKARREFEAERNHSKEMTQHFLISWDGTEDRSIGSRVSAILEDAYRQVGRELGIYPESAVRVVLYGAKEFRRVTGAEEWVGGLFDGAIRVPVRNFTASEEEIRKKLYHEYTHVAVRSLTDRCPTWLNEGLAQFFEGKDARHAQANVLRAKERGALLGLAQLNSSYARLKDANMARLAYAQALLLTRFVMDEHGPEPVRRFLIALGEGTPVRDAAYSVFRRYLEDIHTSWRQGL